MCCGSAWEDTPYAVDDDGRVTLSDNCLLRQALDELRANGAEAELDGERIFQRMGMERTLGEYLSLQRRHPLGEANFTPRTGVRPVTAALAANPTQRYRWVILLIATFAQACACFFIQGIGAIAVFIRTTCNSSLQIGLLVSAAQLVPIVGLLVAGELLDRYSERLVVGLGTLIVALASAPRCGPPT